MRFRAIGNCSGTSTYALLYQKDCCPSPKALYVLRPYQTCTPGAAPSCIKELLYTATLLRPAFLSIVHSTTALLLCDFVLPLPDRRSHAALSSLLLTLDNFVDEMGWASSTQACGGRFSAWYFVTISQWLLSEQYWLSLTFQIAHNATSFHLRLETSAGGHHADGQESASKLVMSLLRHEHIHE